MTRVTERRAGVTFVPASTWTSPLEDVLPIDSPHFAFLLLTAAALVLPRADRRLRAALGLPVCLLGAASLRLAVSDPAPRTFLAISGAMLLLGVATAARQAVASLREAHSQRLPPMISLALAATALALIVDAVRAGGLVRTVLIAAGLHLFGAVLWVGGGLLRVRERTRRALMRLGLENRTPIPGSGKPNSWLVLYAVGAVAAVLAPFWAVTLAGCVVVAATHQVMDCDFEAGISRRVIPSLSLAALAGVWWLLAAVVRPEAPSLGVLADVGISPPVELWLAGLSGFVAAQFFGFWPLHGPTLRPLDGIVGSALLLKLALPAAPLGVEYWQPLAFLVAFCGAWSAATLASPGRAVMAITFAALWTGQNGLPGAALLALLLPVTDPAHVWPWRLIGAVAAIGLALVAAPMLRAEVVFTVLLLGAATALLASLAEAAPLR